MASMLKGAILFSVGALLVEGARQADLPSPTTAADSTSTVRHVTTHTEYKMTASRDPAKPDEQAAVSAINARSAADSAHDAADVASDAASHAIEITNHAQSALGDTWSALRKARVESSNLNTDQRESLKRAETNVKRAALRTDTDDTQSVRTESISHRQLRSSLDRLKSTDSNCDDLCQMRQDLKQLRQRLEKVEGASSGSVTSKRIGEFNELIEELEAEEKAKGIKHASHDNMKSEVERLREAIDRLETRQRSAVMVNTPQDKGHIEYKIPEAREPVGARMQDPEVTGNAGSEVSTQEPVGMTDPVERLPPATAPASPDIDVDTEMPYGELEPFGREDTAQELTENSVSESDKMVDQLERAEVAEEKRAVFRALTRLRGAAITSFDGVARSQTGNIDEYNKIHKWRMTHPLHHLADEESDISKWAFPDNAD